MALSLLDMMAVGGLATVRSRESERSKASRRSQEKRRRTARWAVDGAPRFNMGRMCSGVKLWQGSQGPKSTARLRRSESLLSREAVGLYACFTIKRLAPALVRLVAEWALGGSGRKVPLFEQHSPGQEKARRMRAACYLRPFEQDTLEAERSWAYDWTLDGESGLGVESPPFYRRRFPRAPVPCFIDDPH